MIESLRLRNVGPAPGMDMELAPRLNLITGDNGLCHNQNTPQNTPRQPLTATFLVKRSRTVHGVHASALAFRAPRLSR